MDLSEVHAPEPAITRLRLNGQSGRLEVLWTVISDQTGAVLRVLGGDGRTMQASRLLALLDTAATIHDGRISS